MENRIYDAFASIKANEDQKRSVRQALSAARLKKSGNRRLLPKMLPALGALLLLFSSGVFYNVTFRPAAIVSIDVNPSMELTLNRKNRVIRADAYNEDGGTVLEAVPVRGMNFEDAVAALITSDAMTPYLENGAEWTFTVAAKDSERETFLLETIYSCGERCAQNITGYHADMDCAEKAHAHGFSLGKYAAYLLLNDYDSTVTADECRDKSVSELHQLVQEHETHSGEGHHGSAQDESTPPDQTALPDESRGEYGHHGNGHKSHGGH